MLCLDRVRTLRGSSSCPECVTMCSCVYSSVYAGEVICANNSHYYLCACVLYRSYPAGRCIHKPAHPDLRGCGELLSGPWRTQHLFQDKWTACPGHVWKFQHRRTLLPCCQLFSRGQVSVYVFFPVCLRPYTIRLWVLYVLTGHFIRNTYNLMQSITASIEWSDHFWAFKNVRFISEDLVGEFCI